MADTLRLPVVRRRGVGDDVPDTYSLDAFRADTLFQLDRRIAGQDMETWVRMFRVDTDDCDWSPLD